MTSLNMHRCVDEDIKAQSTYITICMHMLYYVPCSTYMHACIYSIDYNNYP